MAGRKPANPFLCGTEYDEQPKNKKSRIQPVDDVLADQLAVSHKPPSSTRLNKFDSRIHSLVASCADADVLTYTEILTGMLSTPADCQELGHSALSSRFISNPHDRASVALCLHSAYLTQLRLAELDKKIEDMRTAKSVKSTTIVQDQYELSSRSSSLPEDQFLVILPRPFRSINIRCAIRDVVARRKLTSSKSRSIMSEINSAMTHCVRQAISPTDPRKFYFGNRRIANSFTEFNSGIATSIAAGVVSFVTFNEAAVLDGYTAPAPDLDQFRGLALSLLTDIFGDGPNRRKDNRFEFMDDLEYAAHVNSDPFHLKHIQQLEISRFGQVSLITSTNSTYPTPSPSPISPDISSPSVRPKPEIVYTQL